MEENTKKSRFRRPVIYTFTSLGILVLIFGGVFGYRSYELNHLTSAGNGYMLIHDYKDAIKTYTKAQHFGGGAELESKLMNARTMESSHAAFVSGEAAYNHHQYSQAYNDFTKVASIDSVDYSQAQKLGQKSQTLYLVSGVITGTSRWVNDVSTWDTDVNTMVDAANILSTGTYNGTQFQNTLSTLQSDYQQFQSDENQLESDASAIITKGQLIPDPTVKAIISSLDSTLTKFNSDTNQMDADINSQITNATQEIQQGGNSYTGYYTATVDNSTWNPAIDNANSEETLVAKYLAQLQAYRS